MSAGGVSYSGLTSYGKVILPSVDSWGTNNNIARDPPRSITTRRIDKVGDTSNIVEQIDESGSRSCEAINYYARGVNPMVAVSYNNYGSNGGQQMALQNNGGLQAKLPYRIMDSGAFRPPLLGQDMLYPLSRMPRVWFSAFTQPGFADYTKKLRVCGDASNTRQVKSEMIHTEAKPTRVYKFENPIEKNYEVKNVVHPVLAKSAQTQMQTVRPTERPTTVYSRVANAKTLKACGQTNMSSRYTRTNKPDVDVLGSTRAAIIHPEATAARSLDVYKNGGTSLDANRYITESLHGDIHTNPSMLKRQTNIENLVDIDSVRIQVKPHIMNIEYTTPEKKFDKVVYFDTSVDLERNMPLASASTCRTLTANPSHSSRDVHLNEKISPSAWIRDVSGLYSTDMHGNTDRRVLESRKLDLMKTARQNER